MYALLPIFQSGLLGQESTGVSSWADCGPWALWLAPLLHWLNQILFVGLFGESRLDPIYPAWTKHRIYKCTTYRPDLSWLWFICSILMFFKGIFHQFTSSWELPVTGNSQLQNTNTYVVHSGLPASHYSEREQDLNVNDWKEAWKTMRGFTKQMKDERMKGKEGTAGWWRTEVGEEKEGSI